MSTSSRTIRSSKNQGSTSSPTNNAQDTNNTQLSNAAHQQTSLSTGFDNIFDQFRRSFDNLMAPFYPFTGVGMWGPYQLPIRSSIVDLVDEGDHYLVTAELPGFSKDQVDVQINKYGLLIRAERKSESSSNGGGPAQQFGTSGQSTPEKNYLHRERAYSAFERIVEFPEEVTPQKVEGSMKEGILQLTIPKKEPNPEERLTKIQLK